MAKILVADDHKGCRESIRNVLNVLCDVSTTSILLAENGTQAIMMIKDNSDISVVITDYDMPGENGFEVSRQARKLIPSVCIILVTAEADQEGEFKEKALKSGVNHIFNKLSRGTNLLSFLEGIRIGQKK